MTDQSLLTVLHISDFHFCKRKQREQTIIVDALVKDLQSLCIGHRKPDIVVFTGDLVQAAGIDLHDDAYDVLIERVSKASGASDERIFIAPGNHDLSWTGLEAFADEMKLWRSKLGQADEMHQLNELFEQKAFDAAISKKFSNYMDLENYIRGSDGSTIRKISNGFATVDHIAPLNLDVVLFNTAVFSSGGHKDFEDDQHRLAIPEYAVMEAIGALSPGSLRIFATHHPLTWLSEQTARYLEGEFSKHAHVHLFGHMHDPQPKKVIGLKGELLSDQAGALFTARRDSYNGYSLITIDRTDGSAETLVRSYFKDRNEFDAGVDVVEDGRWWSSAAARQHFRKIASPVDGSAFRKHLASAALDALKDRENAAGGEGHAHERFVDPPLRRTFIQEASEDESEIETETPIPFQDVVEGDANLILYAKAEYGRTTLLRELRYRLLSQAEDVRFPRLPALIDFSEVGSNAESTLRKIKGGSEAAPENIDLESLLKLGHACIMVDDVNFADTRRMRALREFVARYPKARYILSSQYSSATAMGAVVDPEMPIRFEFVEIREFRRNDMRQLLAKDERCTDVEEWLDRLQAEFREINLPFTAANGSILIEILSEKYNFTPINRAVLMEQFVDSTLRKAAIEQSRRETFDYTNKTDLLSHVAAWMARLDQYIPTKESVRAEMKSYIDTRGLNVDLDELMSEFLAARIFVSKSEGRISFRYSGVLEYFIALRMTADPSFKDWIMADERYLSYVNEIQYYAGKLRNDAALVELVAERHRKILDEAIADIGEVDLDQFETIQLPTDDDDQAILDTELEIARPPLTRTEKDAELEGQLPMDAEDRQEVFRPNVDQISDRMTLSLALYSGLIKNMELIADSAKRRHLAVIWHGWTVMLIAALRVAPRLAKERRLRINGALYEIQAPYGMSNAALLRRIMVVLPHVQIRLISAALGTEKLERQLTEPTLAEQGEPKIFELLRTGLIADLRLAATPSAIRTLAAKFRDKKYLLWALIVHIGELRRLGGVRDEHYKALEEPLAGAIANLRGGSHRDRINTKRKHLSKLQKDRLMLSVKRERDI